jgi:hypothetical protein
MVSAEETFIASPLPVRVTATPIASVPALMRDETLPSAGGSFGSRESERVRRLNRTPR